MGGRTDAVEGTVVTTRGTRPVVGKRWRINSSGRELVVVDADDSVATVENTRNGALAMQTML